MKLSESMIRRKAQKNNIAQLKLHPTQVAKAPAADMPTDGPRAGLGALELELQNLQALITQGNREKPWATLPDSTPLIQIVTQCGHPDLQHRIFETLVTRAQPVQDRYRDAGKARSDDRQSESMYRGRPTIHCFMRTGRDHYEGGLRHVPAIAGSARSQAPPVPQVGDTGSRNQYTCTAV
jgi:hypothetical protein